MRGARAETSIHAELAQRAYARSPRTRRPSVVLFWPRSARARACRLCARRWPAHMTTGRASAP
eukprot:6052729-Alexandrium_andersonii.AAC.1